LLDGIAAACYTLQNNRPVQRLFVALSLLSVALFFFARPEQLEQQIVSNVSIGEITSAYDGRFVRVGGFMVTPDAYRARYRLGGSELLDKGYTPLISVDETQVIWVAGAEPVGDRAVSAYFVTLVAQVVRTQGDQQPALYLRVGLPLSVLLMRGLAWLSRVMLVMLLVLAVALWLVRRLDYALPLPWPAGQTPAAPPLLWFGSLGRPFSECVVRSRPVQLFLRPYEARFESANGWGVSVRRLQRAHLFQAATRYGGLPAMRLHFEDERGLRRRGVLIANSVEARQALLQALSLIR
jgi:hypothetical protein